VRVFNGKTPNYFSEIALPKNPVFKILNANRMSKLSHLQFLKTLPDVVVPKLPAHLQKAIVPHQPFRWIIQFHFGEPRLHYEVTGVRGRDQWELGFHWEAKDKNLNRYLLDGFRRQLFEIKDVLGESVEAEMWDKGWAKIYDLVEGAPLTPAYQEMVGARLAEIIVYLHPIYVDLRRTVAQVYR
jgi:hypothetical protein